MMDRKYLAILLLLAVGSLPCLSLAQEASPPDIIVDLNEGILHYLEAQGDVYGPGDPDGLTVALETLTSVLERDADNHPALLFRALVRGELGLTELAERRNAETDAQRYERVLEARAGEKDLATLDRELEQLEERLQGYREAHQAGNSEEAAADWAVALAERRDLRGLRDRLEEVAGKSDEDLAALRRDAMAEARAAAQREQAHYREMVADLGYLVGLLDHPEAVIRLLEVVANAKIARIDETTARDIIQKDLAPRDAPGPVKALRQAAAHGLERAAGILQRMLDEGLTGEHLVRTKFFLGVIRYRQAVPVRGKGERLDISAGGRRRLAEARVVMTELADDVTSDRTWRSYAALYLGLILPFEATGEVDAASRDSLLDQAEDYLRLAAQLDVHPPESPAGQPRSDSGVIPFLVARQRQEIAKLRGEGGAVVPAMNDLRLSVGFGAHYDSNVVLLGERTDLPRDISREDDFGFTLITAMDYTKDLAENLTFGCQGRMSQMWHADVDEYDQQTYGGTIALQYEVYRTEGSFGPVYLALQYDYDYTLLGRSAFLESHALRPHMRFFWENRQAETDLYFRYGIRDYREPLYDRRYNRDGNYLALGLSHRHKTINMTEVYQNHGLEPWGHPGDPGLQQDDPDYPNRYLTPRIGLEYSWDATDGDEFDRKAYLLGVGVGIPLPWGVNLDAMAGFEWGEYAHGSLIDYHRRPRRDFTQEYGIALSRTFVLREGELMNRYTPQFDRVLMTVRVGAQWTEDDSNVVDRLGEAIFSYDRLVYGFTVGFAFN